MIRSRVLTCIPLQPLMANILFVTVKYYLTTLNGQVPLTFEDYTSNELTFFAMLILRL